jgi:hypothetical protein
LLSASRSAASIGDAVNGLNKGGCGQIDAVLRSLSTFNLPNAELPNGNMSVFWKMIRTLAWLILGFHLTEEQKIWVRFPPGNVVFRGT